MRSVVQWGAKLKKKVIILLTKWIYYINLYINYINWFYQTQKNHCKASYYNIMDFKCTEYAIGTK